MDLEWISRILCLICNLFYACATLYYETPSLDDQFEHFEITSGIPTFGTVGGQGAEVTQSPLTMTMGYRTLVTFQFRGKGNAFILFQQSGDPHNSFTVELGGGPSFDRIAVYNQKPYSKQPLIQKSVTGLTSATESRWFWIYWNIKTRYVHVGVCTDPNEGELLQYSPLVHYNITNIYLSTNQENGGQWEFPSENELFGACDSEYFDCSDGDVVCDGDFGSRTLATCINLDGGSGPLGGNCPYICNDEIVCSSGGACREGLCTSAPLEESTNVATSKNEDYTTSITTPKTMLIATSHSVDEGVSTAYKLSAATGNFHSSIIQISSAVVSPAPTVITNKLTAEISTVYTNVVGTENTFVSITTTINSFMTTFPAIHVSESDIYAMTSSIKHVDTGLDNPGFFDDIGRISAVAVSGLVAAMGAAGLTIYTLAYRCRPSNVTPITTGRPINEDEEKEPVDPPPSD